MADPFENLDYIRLEIAQALDLLDGASQSRGVNEEPEGVNYLICQLRRHVREMEDAIDAAREGRHKPEPAGEVASDREPNRDTPRETRNLIAAAAHEIWLFAQILVDDSTDLESAPRPESVNILAWEILARAGDIEKKAEGMHRVLAA